MDKKWQEIIKHEQQKPYYKELETFLKNEYDTKVIHPIKEDVFNAFLYTPFSDVKVVILGQDPYHNFNQAHGLAFSVLKGNKIPPSLVNMYKELHADLKLPIPSHGELTNWAKEGVLLLNTILTVEHNKPLSHKGKGWEIFTNQMIKILNQDSSPKVFVLWGNNAKKKASLITNKTHLVLQSSHPSPLSARHSFFGSKVYSKINRYLEENGIKPIDFQIR